MKRRYISSTDKQPSFLDRLWADSTLVPGVSNIIVTMGAYLVLSTASALLFPNDNKRKDE